VKYLFLILCTISSYASYANKEVLCEYDLLKSEYVNDESGYVPQKAVVNFYIKRNGQMLNFFYKQAFYYTHSTKNKDVYKYGYSNSPFADEDQVSKISAMEFDKISLKISRNGGKSKIYVRTRREESDLYPILPNVYKCSEITY
jgi:hypothetical protein